MKKKVIVGIIAILFIAAVIFALLPRVSVDPAEGGKVTFRYGWSDISALLEEEDRETIADIVNGKRIHSKIYLNGFSEDISVTVDSVTFCPARDMSPILYLAEKDRYITLSNEENNTLRTILESYGFTFPCP